MKYFKFFPKIQYDLDDNGQLRDIVDVFRFAKIVKEVQDDIKFYRKYDVQDGERPDHVSYKLYGSVDYHWTFFLANPEMKSLYDGWPRSYNEMESYIANKYPNFVLNIDITSSNFFYNKFTVGETVQGLISGATATIVDKNTSLGWIEISNKVGNFRNNEIVRGTTSSDFVTISGQAEKKNAAHHFVDGDGFEVSYSTPGKSIVTFFKYEIDKNDAKKSINVIRDEYISQVATQFREALNG